MMIGRMSCVALAACIATATIVPALGPAVAADGGTNVVLEWNETAGAAARAGCLAPANDPLHEARMYALAFIAVHDALNAIDRRFEPYAYDAQAPAGASAAAAVAAAAHDALAAALGDLPSELFPPVCGVDGLAVVNDAYDAALAAIPDGDAKTDGIATGQAAAAAIVALRALITTPVTAWRAASRRRSCGECSVLTGSASRCAA
jgi:hypothetical protein